jgi:hypothetical protein
MKRSRLGTLIAAGVIAAAPIILAAPAANAKPADTPSDCVDQGGRLGSVPHYEFDTSGNGTQVGRAYYCDIGNQRIWYE